MNITHIIIHQLDKEAMKLGSTLTLFDSTVDKTDKRVVKLITELNNRYKNRNETYAVFDTKKKANFHTAFDKYYKTKSEESFVSFTKDSAADLATRIDGSAPAKGGYIIFAHYEEARNFVGVFLVRNTIGMTFNKDKTKFTIADVAHIDFENLAMACRINLNLYNKKDMRYLSFINKKSDEDSQFFIRWISSEEAESNAEDTDQLYNILNDVPLPTDEGAKKPIERNELLERAYDSIKATPGKILNIRDLSKTLFGDASYLPNYIDEAGLTINGEFKAHNDTLRKFVKVKAKADDIELSFSRAAYKKKSIRFDSKNDSQIIITSEKLAAEVRSMLAKS